MCCTEKRRYTKDGSPVHGPPLIIEDEFYRRSKRVLRTLNGRICVDKLYITIIRIKDPSYTLGPIFPELHESMNVIGWVSWSGERVTIFEGGGGGRAEALRNDR